MVTVEFDEEMHADIEAERARATEEASAPRFRIVDDGGRLVDVVAASDGAHVETLELPGGPALRASMLRGYRP